MTDICNCRSKGEEEDEERERRKYFLGKGRVSESTQCIYRKLNLKQKK